MSVLFSLLIFQSLWNVAAAFCVHKNQEKALQHFGHHADLNDVATVHHDSKLHKVTIASDTNVIKLQNDFWLIYRCFKKVFL
jgi:hypothetical protein